LATSARMGNAPLRPGEKPVWPPPIPPRTLRRGHSLTSSNDQRYVGSILAVMATLDMDEVCRLSPSDLPPEIKWTVRALSEQEWRAVCREAIKAQRRFIGMTQGIHCQLRRDEPWLLAEFLPTMRS
jgi:hypothetical protein